MAGYGNFNFAAIGSSVIAVSSYDHIAPTWTCWRLLCEDFDDAKILTLYLNSTFSIAKLIDISIEVGGSLRKWRKDKLLSMLVLDPKKLTEAQKMYYQMLGWDESGVPTYARLVELDIEWAYGYSE